MVSCSACGWAQRAHLDRRVLQMEVMPLWPEKWASDYKGADGILELKVPFDKVQYRPLGMHSPTGRRIFVLLGGGVEKGGKLPKGVLQSVQQRRKALLEEPNWCSTIQNRDFKGLWRKFTDKAYREAFVSADISTTIAAQIHALREQRGWTQKQLADAAGMAQTRISVLEDPSYEKSSLTTLKRLASAFDVGLLVKFVPLSQQLRLATEFGGRIAECSRLCARQHCI